MTGRRVPLRKLVVAPIVWVSFALLVFPLAISKIDTRLFSPLAVPGYVLFVLMSIIGNVLPKVRNFGFRLYWEPFVIVCYGVSVAVGAGYYAGRRDVSYDHENNGFATYTVPESNHFELYPGANQ